MLCVWQANSDLCLSSQGKRLTEQPLSGCGKVGGREQLLTGPYASVGFLTRYDEKLM